MKAAFSLGGDLRTLRVPRAVDDPRSVTFGRNHDTVKDINPLWRLIHTSILRMPILRRPMS